MMTNFLSRKVEYISSSIYSRILLSTNNPKQHHFPPQLGLITILHSEEKLPSRMIHCYTLEPPPPSSSSLSEPLIYPSSPPSEAVSSLLLSSSYSFCCTMIGDVIGTESGDCMISDVVELVELRTKSEPIQGKMSRVRERSSKTRKFPPPITLMSQTEQMPWSFKKEYSSDGRIVMRAERVTRHEYVETHRENGRLTVRLVPEEEDDIVWSTEEEEEVEMEIEELEFNEEDDAEELEGGAYVEEEEDEEEEEEEEKGELAKEGSVLLQSCSLENKGVWCVAYGGGLGQDSDSFWKGSGIGDANGYLGRPGSAPLRPMMTPVM